jgi:hypothetical protein
MNSADVLARLRRFLLLFSALLFVGALIELWLTGHTENFVQLIPFALCGLAIIALLVVLFNSRRAYLLGLRVCMGLVMLGSLYGVYEHFINNIAFQREITPNATTSDVVMTALAGANPLLAPGILAAAAILALAATYHHPALGSGDEKSRNYNERSATTLVKTD